MRKLVSTLFIFGLLISATAGNNASAAGAVPDSFADTVEKLMPAVVNVSTTQKVKGGGMMTPDFQFPDLPPDSGLEQFKDFFDQFNKQRQGEESDEGNGTMPERKMFSLGSGFIIDPSGYIVTNNHVIAEADEISVKLSDGSEYKAKIVGKDKSTDLALLKVEASKPLPSVKFGDSDKSRVGDWIIAIGNPFGLGETVTAGIISARSRDIYSGPFDDFIQTDAAINRGNSGGPMFNTEGEVIGINTAIFSPSGGNVGIGFAVPVSLAEPVIKQLKEKGHVKRGWLGVKIQTISDEIAESLGMKSKAGALVVEVTKDSPADKAGIKTGDVIVKFDGREVVEMRKLPRMVAETQIGKKVDVLVLRHGETKTLSLTTGELKDTEEKAEKASKEPEEESYKGSKEVLGLSMVPLNAELADKIGAASGVKGVVIVGVSKKSPAIERGVRKYDIITRVNEYEVTTPEQVSQKIDEAKKSGRKNALLRVVRGNDTLFITVPVE